MPLLLADPVADAINAMLASLPEQVVGVIEGAAPYILGVIIGWNLLWIGRRLLFHLRLRG